MKASFEHSVDVLVKAYLNNTLKNGWCTACACGNLVADAMNTTIGHDGHYFGNGVQANWDQISFYGKLQPVNMQSGLYRKGLEQVEITGYTPEQIAKIEYAFEKAADYSEGLEERMYKGLMCTVDALADIHGVDLDVKEEAKKMFIKPELV